jgi:hypothetical protein
LRPGVQFQDQVQAIRGSLELIVRRSGRVVLHDKDRNLIVNGARQNMARLLTGEGSNRIINRIAVGTNGAPPSPTDTAITNAFMKPITSFSYPTPTSARFNFLIKENEANGMAIMEFGLIAADGSLFARRTRGGKVIEKEDDLEIEGFWTILF